MPMDPLAGLDDDTSSEDDDATSQATEDDPEVPNNLSAPPAPTTAPPPPNAGPSTGVSTSGPPRERPKYVLKHTMRGHTASLSMVKFSPDGQLLASCCGSFSSSYVYDLTRTGVANDKLVKIWNPFTGELIRNLTGHLKGLSDIAWTGDSMHLASASDDTTIRIWNVDSVRYFFGPAFIMHQLEPGSRELRSSSSEGTPVMCFASTTIPPRQFLCRAAVMET